MSRSVRVAERLALPTSDHGVAGSNPAGGEILPEPKRRFIAQSLSYSPFHRLEMTEILLKGRKTLTHPSIQLCLWEIFRRSRIPNSVGTATNPSPSSQIYQCDKTFCSLFLRIEFRNRAMLYGETVIELLNIDIAFLYINEYVTRQFKMCCRGEKGTFSNFNTEIRINLLQNN